VVVPELGGTTTVVVLAGGGVLTQPQSMAARINKLDTAFILHLLVHSIGVREHLLLTQGGRADRGVSRVSHAL
jgi:hypothetical protein